MLIYGVVVADTVRTYVGGWYQYQDPVPAAVSTIIALMIPTIIADNVGLGFFFLFAGYPTPGSYDRKDGAAFVQDRLVRLGIPLVLYDLLLDPLVAYMARWRPSSFWSFYSPYLLWMRTIGP